MLLIFPWTMLVLAARRYLFRAKTRSFAAPPKSRAAT
jgi:hypothetical protein